MNIIMGPQAAGTGQSGTDIGCSYRGRRTETELTGSGMPVLRVGALEASIIQNVETVRPISGQGHTCPHRDISFL